MIAGLPGKGKEEISITKKRRPFEIRQPISLAMKNVEPDFNENFD